MLTTEVGIFHILASQISYVLRDDRKVPSDVECNQAQLVPLLNCG